MDNQDAKRIGNQHSTLLDQLIKAAEGVKPKKITPFSDSIIKIASHTPPSLTDTLAKVAAAVATRKKFFKTAQFGPPAPKPMPGQGAMPMPKPMDGPPDLGGGDMGGDLALDDELGGSEPDFDAMAGGEEGMPGDELGMGGDEMGMGGDIEGAKQSLADALKSLCGGVEQAMECLQSSEGMEDGLGMEDEGLGAEDEFGLEDEGLEDEALGDDMIPSDILGGDEPDDMMKPMEQDPMMQQQQDPMMQQPHQQF